jgi:hypothetical protein
MASTQNRFISKDLLGDLVEALGLPLHPQGFLPTASGGYKMMALEAGLWEKVKEIAVAPFVADGLPTAATTGIYLPEFPQARIHVNFIGGLGVEKASFTVWHRQHNIDDGTLGHWTRGQVCVNVDHLEEVLDPYLWHAEIYIQMTAVAPGATTQAAVFVQGVKDMTAGADVNVVVPPVSVAIDSLAKVPPDNLLAILTEDGLPAGTKHVLRGDKQGNIIVSPDNAYRCIPVNLAVANPAPGLLHAVPGRDLAVVFTDGNFNLRFNAAGSDPIQQTAADHGSWENTEFTQFYVENLAQPGKTAILYVGQRV